MYACLCGTGAHGAGVHRVQNRLSNPRIQELQVAASLLMWVLGSELRASARAERALNH